MRALSAEHYSCRHHNHTHTHGSTSEQLLKSVESAPNPQVGLDGMGDPYFPKMGNGGYDATHYDLDLKVNPKTRMLNASTTMAAKATQDLNSFNLDFQGFDISRITVNGKEAQFQRKDGELTVSPQDGIAQGQDFKVQVDYAGKPESYNSPYAPIPIGWNSIADGSYVLSEPDGASHWFPVNDHPRDKASYSFKVTVPNEYQAVCNGVLQEKQQHGDSTSYVWEAKEQMASYLATVNVGKFVEQSAVSPQGVPITNFFPASIAKKAESDFGRVPEMMDFFTKRYGDYPFSSYGNLVVDASVGGAALETQTRPIYERGMVTGDRRTEFVYAHELAHQWWGDNTSVKDWKDIWLNEGFANYSHMMWKHEHEGGMKKLDRAMYQMYMFLPRHDAPVSDPGQKDMFSENVYNRGAVALHQLRKNLGDETFFNSLKAFQKEFGGKNVTTDDFIKTVNQVTGKDNNAFFDKWVKSPDLPAWSSGSKADGERHSKAARSKEAPPERFAFHAR